MTRDGTTDETGLSKREKSAALARATQSIKELLGKRRRNDWTIGRKLIAVQELELFAAKGHANVGEYAEKELGLSSDEAYMLIRVAGSYDEDTVVSTSVELLDRGLRLIGYTKKQEKPSDVLNMMVDVPTGTGDDVERRRYGSLDHREARRAVAWAAKQSGPVDHEPRLAPFVVRAATVAHRALDAAVGKKHAAACEVRARRADGEAFLDVSRVPFAMAEKAFLAMAAALAEARHAHDAERTKSKSKARAARPRAKTRSR